MPFTTSLLDDFNRSAAAAGAAGALSTTYGWFSSDGLWGTSTLPTDTVVGGGPIPLDHSAASWNGGAWWGAQAYGTSFSADQEVYCTCTTTAGSLSVAQSRWALYGRIQNPGNPSTLACYAVKLDKVSGSSFNSTVSIARWNGTTRTSLFSTGYAGLSTSDTNFQLGLRVFDLIGSPYIEAWVKPVSGSWTRIISGFDTSGSKITSAGYVGLTTGKIDTANAGVGTLADDFSGGGITNPGATVLYPGVVIDDNVERTDADAGTFYGLGSQGQLPIPAQSGTGTYFVKTSGGGIVTIRPQGGGISVY